MGKSKHLTRIMGLFKKSPVVDFNSIERIISAEKTNKKSGYAKLLVHNLIKKGVIKKLLKGRYSLKDDPSLATLCLNPAYLGLQSAMSFHGLWEQETIPIIITSEKVRSGMREVLNSNVLIRRTQKKYVFGFEYYQDGSSYLPYSDIEKTFIDMIIFKQHLSRKALLEFKKRIDKKKLASHLQKYPEQTRKKILDAEKKTKPE